MKLVIIEGPDRTGKNTLIKNLCSNIDNYIVRHWVSPIGITDSEKFYNQYLAFIKEFESASLRYNYYRNSVKHVKDLYIWNRSHIGEFVYGTMYRNTKPEKWVLNLEKEYNFDIQDDIYLILLIAPPDFLVSKDDGKSFSADIKNKKQELEKFKDAFNSSIIKNKMLIEINDGDSYRQDVHKEVESFIYK